MEKLALGCFMHYNLIKNGLHIAAQSYSLGDGAEGKQPLRFQPVSSCLDAGAMDRLRAALTESLEKNKFNAFLLVLMIELVFFAFTR
ncbi:MAG: hypothetical protein LBU32_00205 [Clostridiales bacterium]|nr:hypothetical protein [Clostridiales bacterium]